MLPLRRSELTIYFSPGQVRLVQPQRMRRGGSEDIVTLACVPSNQSPWAAPVSALESLLKTNQQLSGNITVVLSNHYARYMLVPWSDLMLRHDEQATYVQHLFAETYGSLVDGYELRVSDAAFGQPRIASAVAIELLERIREVIHNAGSRLCSVQPYLMNAFNEHRHSIRKHEGWFITVEHGILGITGIAKKRWQIVRTVRCDDHWSQDMKFHLDRLYLGGESDMIPKIIHWCSPDFRTDISPLPAPWKINRLSPADIGRRSGSTELPEAANPA